jgi:hypothetical protein
MCWENLSPSLPCASSPPLSPGFSKGRIGAKVNTTTARRRAARIPDLIQIDLLLQSRVNRRSQKKSSFTVCVRVLRGVVTCGTKSLHPVLSHRSRGVRIYTTLRSAMSASSSTLVQRVLTTKVCHRIPS